MASGFGVEKEDSVRTPQLPPYRLCLALQCSFFYLLDKEVPLVFRCPSILSPDDTRGPVQVEHVYQMLFLVLQLLDLGLQLSINTLQFLRLLGASNRGIMEGAKEWGGGGLPGNLRAPQTERDLLEEPSYHKNRRTKIGGRWYESCRGLRSWETCKRKLRDTTEPDFHAC